VKPKLKIATAQTPDGGEMQLFQHDRDFSIIINGQDLMNSRQNESELELARLGCAHLTDSVAPRILIGGLGLGFTLRQALDILSPKAQVMVGELMDEVIQWNRDYLGELNGHPLTDKRVDLRTGDIVALIEQSKNEFDAILLDIDNGPAAMTDSGNRRLYGFQGMEACRQALKPHGVLAVWSADPSKKFEQLLMRCSFHVSRFRIPAYKGSNSQTRFVYVAAGEKNLLPPGGGEPRQPIKATPKKKGRRQQKNRW